ncbi:MAG: 16S rRNA (cytosine(967)-C(5))-methyltransferase RsmB [Thermoflavifilum sp.]|nr:16S rRNA (cytosine(967)-C(5))-methyltransferase RsmB [Thermoflavifilum sp.]MCL6513312.1 16S rRNA (cytosine(967)-C(5))-methyltransferase RsmB [Alicyclobacillus sp.]
MSGARELAYEALLQVETGDAFTNLALQAVLGTEDLGERDRALCTEIVYGTVQRRRSIDVLLAPHLSRPVDALDPEVLTILRMTVYQLAFLTRVPAYAALNEAVELCKRVKPQAAGFVNGVLRQFSRVAEPVAERLARAAARAATPAAALGILYSYPDWMVERWLRQFGRARTEALLRAGNEQATLSLRVNRLRTTTHQVLARLREEGTPATPSPLHPWGIRLERGVNVEAWAPYQMGLVSVQDEGAMLVAQMVAPTPGSRVLDMCAAPGGKTTHLAEFMEDQGSIDAIDIHPHKLGLLRQAAIRLGLRSIRTMLADGRDVARKGLLPGGYDAVLVDAPCSGLGVLRHRPDIRWRRSEADIASLAELQRDLLRAAATLVRPGGVLVYATCTLLAEENDDVVRWALDSPALGLALGDARPHLPAAVSEMLVDHAMLTLTPDAWGTDGFFMARLIKRTEA